MSVDFSRDAARCASTEPVPASGWGLTAELRRAREEPWPRDPRGSGIVEGAVDAVFVLRTVRRGGRAVDFSVVDVNGAGEALLGIPRSAMVGRCVSEVPLEAERERLLREGLEVIETRRVHDGELDRRHAAKGPERARYQVAPFGDGLIVSIRDITSERRHLELLELHSAIVRSIGEGICLVRASDRRIVYANPRFEALFGYDRGELDGRPVSVLNYSEPESSPTDKERTVVEKLSLSGEATYEVVNVKKDGSRMLCRGTTTTIEHPEHGRVWVAVHEDITQRRRIEKVLELQQLVVQHMNEGVLLVRDDDGLIVFANPKMEKMFGYEPGELQGRAVSTLTYGETAEDAQRISDSMVETLRRDGEATFELACVRKDGSRLWCRGKSVGFDHPDFGRVWATVQEDVTEWKRAMDATAELAAIFESTYEAIIVKTPEGIICNWNRGAERLYGFTAKEAIGRSTGIIVPPELLGVEREQLARIRRGERIPRSETERLRKDGTRLVIAYAMSPIYDASGDVVGVASIGHDITDRKRAERALHQSLQEKEVLLREVHHRVKNNLQVISSLLRLQADAVTEESAKTALEDSRKRVRAIALLHEKLYRSENLGSVAMDEYVESLVGALLDSCDSHIEVAVDVAGVPLPVDTAVPCGLILNELITNALKHAFVGVAGRKPRIGVRLTRVGSALELAVVDNGLGVRDASELKTARTLGMHLVRTLARQLNGTVFVETDAGTNICVRFPERPVGEG